MDILTPSQLVCTTPRITGGETLAELQAIKTAMVREAIEAGHLQACAVVAQELGEPFTRRGYESWAAYRWQLAGVTIEFYRGRGDYLPARGAYAVVSVLTVFTGGRQVAYYRETTDQREQPDNFIAPGAWLDVVYQVATRAQEIHDKRTAARKEADRLALLDLLTNGKAL